MLRIARFISHFESNGDRGLWVFFLLCRLQQSFNNQFVFFICSVLYVSLKQSRVFSYPSCRPKDNFICVTILLQRRKKEACNFSLCSSPVSLIILIFHFLCSLPLMIPHFLSHCFIKEHIFLSPTTFCSSSFCFLLSSSLPSRSDTLPPCIILLLRCFPSSFLLLFLPHLLLWSLFILLTLRFISKGLPYRHRKWLISFAVTPDESEDDLKQLYVVKDLRRKCLKLSL